MEKKILMVILLLTVVGFGQTPRFKLVGSCPLEPDTWYDCFDVIVLDTFAFLANEDLTIINIARPDSPFIITQIDTTHSFRYAIGPAPPYMYAMGMNGFASFDISNMQSPIFLDSINMWLGGDLSLYNSYIYCTTGDYLHLFDASVPENLQYLGIVDSSYFAGRLTNNNNLLFELTEICSLLVFDTSDPANPEKISSLRLPTVSGLSESEPFFRNSLLYVSRLSFYGHGIGLWVINVVDPYNPYLLATSPDTIGAGGINDAYDLTISGNYAYATFGSQIDRSVKRQDQPENVVVFDVSDSANPLPVWIYETVHTYHLGIDSHADTIYLCDGAYFYIFVDTLWTGIGEETKNANTTVSTLQIHPNPFSDKINIQWHVRDERIKLQDLSLNIYDISGRLVRQFHQSSRNMLNQISWDGRDDEGRKIESGVYFVILRYGQSFCVQQKVVLIK